MDSFSGLIQAREMHFLILRQLAEVVGPDKIESIARILNTQGLLPTRMDITGREHPLSYSDLIKKNSWVPPNFLKQLLGMLLGNRMSSLTPFQPKTVSFLGRGSTSVMPFFMPAHPSEKFKRKPTPSTARMILNRETKGRMQRQTKLLTNLEGRMRELKCIVGHKKAIWCIVISNNGRRMYTGADDGLIKSWRIFDGQLLQTYRKHTGEVTQVSISNDDKMLASSSEDASIRLWDTSNCTPLAVFEVHRDAVMRVLFSPEGKNLLSISLDGNCKLWDIKNLNSKLPVTYRVHKVGGTGRQRVQCLCVSFHPSGTEFVVGTNDNSARVYSTKANARMYQPYPSNSSSVDKWQDSTMLRGRDLRKFIGMTDAEHRNQSRLRDLDIIQTMNRLISVLDGHSNEVNSVSYSNGANRIVTGSQDGTARLWVRPDEATRYKLQRHYICYGFIDTRAPSSLLVKFSPDDRWVVTADETFQVKVWDSFSLQKVKVISHHKRLLHTIAFSPLNSRLVLTSGDDGMILLWDILTGSVVRKFRVKYPVFDAMFSKNGCHIVATTSNGTIHIFGTGSREFYFPSPDEQFFERDYERVDVTENGHIVDSHYNLPAHLIPAGNLTNLWGNPYVTQPTSFAEQADVEALPQPKIHRDATYEERNSIIDAHRMRIREISRKIDAKVVDRLASIRLDQKRAEYSDSDGDDTKQPVYGNMVPPTQRFTLSQLRYRLTNPIRAPAPNVPVALPQIEENDVNNSAGDDVEILSATMAGQVNQQNIFVPPNASEGNSARRRRNRTAQFDDGNDADSLYSFGGNTPESEHEEDEDYEDPTISRRTRRSTRSSRRERKQRERSSGTGRRSRRRRVLDSEEEEEELDEDTGFGVSLSSRSLRLQRREFKRQQDLMADIAEELTGERMQVEDGPPTLHRNDNRWLQKCTYDKSCLVPQVGDRLVYFHQGHYKALTDDVFKPIGVFDRVNYELPPYELYPNLSPMLYTEVQSLEYVRSLHAEEINIPRVFCRLKLRILKPREAFQASPTHENKQPIEPPETIYVNFYKVNTPEYLVLESRVEQNKLLGLAPKSRFRTWYPDVRKFYSGQIRYIRPSDSRYLDSPWESCLVRWDVDGPFSSDDEIRDIDMKASSAAPQGKEEKRLSKREAKTISSEKDLMMKFGTRRSGRSNKGKTSERFDPGAPSHLQRVESSSGSKVEMLRPRRASRSRRVSQVSDQVVDEGHREMTRSGRKRRAPTRFTISQDQSTLTSKRPSKREMKSSEFESSSTRRSTRGGTRNEAHTSSVMNSSSHRNRRFTRNASVEPPYSQSKDNLPVRRSRRANIGHRQPMLIEEIAEIAKVKLEKKLHRTSVLKTDEDSQSRLSLRSPRKRKRPQIAQSSEASSSSNLTKEKWKKMPSRMTRRTHALLLKAVLDESLITAKKEGAIPVDSFPNGNAGTNGSTKERIDEEDERKQNMEVEVLPESNSLALQSQKIDGLRDSDLKNKSEPLSSASDDFPRIIISLRKMSDGYEFIKKYSKDDPGDIDVVDDGKMGENYNSGDTKPASAQSEADDAASAKEEKAHDSGNGESASLPKQQDLDIIKSQEESNSSGRVKTNERELSNREMRNESEHSDRERNGTSALTLDNVVDNETSEPAFKKQRIESKVRIGEKLPLVLRLPVPEGYKEIVKDPPGLDRISPWECESLDKALMYRPPRLSMDLRTGLLNAVSSILHEESYREFHKPVDFTAFPTYLKLINVPMDLSTIYKRLENNYYRTPQAFVSDAELLADNCAKFNLQNSEITSIAKKIARILCEHLEKIQAEIAAEDSKARQIETLINNVARDQGEVPQQISKNNLASNDNCQVEALDGDLPEGSGRGQANTEEREVTSEAKVAEGETPENKLAPEGKIKEHTTVKSGSIPLDTKLVDMDDHARISSDQGSVRGNKNELSYQGEHFHKDEKIIEDEKVFEKEDKLQKTDIGNEEKEVGKTFADGTHFIEDEKVIEGKEDDEGVGPIEKMVKENRASSNAS